MKPEIICHRGCWRKPAEKNTFEALAQSFRRGWGVETDVRDCDGRLVVSHDPPSRSALDARHLLEEYRRSSAGASLAINIKADGLQSLLRRVLNEFDIERYFVFDMSIPETVVYLREGFHVFVRQSEWEPVPLLYEEARGVWMDCFVRDWIVEDDIVPHVSAGKQVCLVSPEIHGRPAEVVWERLAEMSLDDGRVMLCTDRPEEAREYFHA